MTETRTANRADRTRSLLLRALERSQFMPYTGGTEGDDPHRATSADEGFSGVQAARIVGITYRQLDYWARTDLVRPSLTDNDGSGSRRRYSYKDLLELRVIKNLLDAGIKLESVREVFHYMREHVGSDIASAHLVISGDSVVLAKGDELIDVLNKGQGVLNVLSLASVKHEVDAQLGSAASLPEDEDELQQI